MAEAVQMQPQMFRRLDRFKMFAPVANTYKRSILSWGTWRGNPRATVYTNVVDDPDPKKRIEAKMDPQTFQIFTEQLEAMCDTAGEQKQKIDCMTSAPPGEDGRPSREIIPSTELWFGKNSEGVVWVSVIAPNRPRIMFEFHVSEYHRLYKLGGEAFTKAEASVAQARATIRQLRMVMGSAAGELEPERVMDANAAARSQASAPVPARAATNTKFEDIPY